MDHPQGENSAATALSTGGACGILMLALMMQSRKHLAQVTYAAYQHDQGNHQEG